MSRGDRAKELFLQGYNCAQAVALAFSNVIDLPEKTIARLVSAFGGGMGGLREVCGAVSAMFFVLSVLKGYDDNKNFEAKKELYAQVQTLSELFKKENGSIVCRELLGLSCPPANSAPAERTAQYYKKRPCADLAKSAADILETFLAERAE